MIDFQKMKKIRKEMKTTQTDVAKKSQISIGYYSEIENGNRQPAVDTLITIAKTLGVTVNDLLVDCGAKRGASQCFEVVGTESSLNHLEEGERGGEGGSVELLSLRVWKEVKEVLVVLDPSRIADGLSCEERHDILKDGREARDWLDQVITAIEFEESSGRS